MTLQDAINILKLKDGDKSSIKKAYRTLSKQNHPDKGGSVEHMQKINETYEMVMNRNWVFESPVKPNFWTFETIFASIFAMCIVITIIKIAIAII